MTRSWLAALLLTSPSAWAQPVIAPPQLGFVQDADNALRPANGVAGNFILGPMVAGNILSTAFSGSIGLLKTDSSLAAFDPQGKLLSSIDVSGGPALFAFSPAGNLALAYIASSGAWIEWRGGAFAPVSLSGGEALPDAVLAIALPTPLEASVLVQRDDMVWELSFPLGKWGAVSEKALSGVRAPVLVLPSGDVVFSGAHGIVIRRTDASEVHVAASLPSNFSLQQMNRDWVQLSDLTSRARFAIPTAPGREGFYQLPEQTK